MSREAVDFPYRISAFLQLYANPKTVLHQILLYHGWEYTGEGVGVAAGRSLSKKVLSSENGDKTSSVPCVSL